MNKTQTNSKIAFTTPTRREALYGLIAGLGSVALTSALQADLPMELASGALENPLGATVGLGVEKPAKTKAKRCIF